MVRVKLREHELKKLNSFRTEAWLTQEAVAGLLGIKVGTFVDYEYGTSDIPLEFLQKLAELYNKEEIKKFGVKVGSLPKASVDIAEDQTQKTTKTRLSSELYDLSKVRKPFRIVQTDELNLYIPEKWAR